MSLYEKIFKDADEIIDQLKAKGIDVVVDNAGEIFFVGILCDVCSDLYDNDGEDFYQHLIDYKGNAAEAIWDFYLDCYEASDFSSVNGMISIINDFIGTKCINHIDVDCK